MENDVRLKSSRKQRSHILGIISQARAEALLADWANMRMDTAGSRHLLHNYPEIAIAAGDDVMNQTVVLCMAGMIRSAWNTPDLRTFEWRLWEAQAYYLSSIVTIEREQMITVPVETFVIQKDPPAVITAVEGMLFYLRHNRARALFCPTPTCSNPYFFQKRKSQKYCSEECAYPSKAESKRRWWANRRSTERKAH